jgi:hypothetical protein
VEEVETNTVVVAVVVALLWVGSLLQQLALLAQVLLA